MIIQKVLHYLNHYELFSLVNRNIREKNLSKKTINFMRVEVGL